mgnify:CR=1 FL=1
METFDGTENAIFFALYNYYGYEGQHFTNKWLGMNDALANHGITVVADNKAIPAIFNIFLLSFIIVPPLDLNTFLFLNIFSF